VFVSKSLIFLLNEIKTAGGLKLLMNGIRIASHAPPSLLERLGRDVSPVGSIIAETLWVSDE
jgi:hypothetical protein